MTENLFLNWIVGPQLIGLLFIIVGAIQKHFPPKEINSLYGYRTKRSMQNQQSWDEANRYSTQLITKCGWVIFVLGIIATLVLLPVAMDVNIKTTIKVGLMLLAAFATVAVLTISTEKHLKRLFENTPL